MSENGDAEKFFQKFFQNFQKGLVYPTFYPSFYPTVLFISMKLTKNDIEYIMKEARAIINENIVNPAMFAAPAISTQPRMKGTLPMEFALKMTPSQLSAETSKEMEIKRVIKDKNSQKLAILQLARAILRYNMTSKEIKAWKPMVYKNDEDAGRAAMEIRRVKNQKYNNANGYGKSVPMKQNVEP